jgi:FkbM family methyltransferase
MKSGSRTAISISKIQTSGNDPVSANLARRVRALSILNDLQTLAALGTAVEAPLGHTAEVLDAYRYHARLGEFDHLAPYLVPDAVSVDVGANFGQYALKLAANCRSCIVIEPQPDLAWLGQALPPNCRFRAAAAGADRGQALLKTPYRNGEKAYGLATLGDNYDAEKRDEQPVPVMPLDDILLELCPDEQVGLIKIDVEGTEASVLSGAAATLARWMPNVQVEIWPENVDRLTQLFVAAGYRGQFYFEGRLLDINRYESRRHTAPENAWRAEAPDEYDPNRYVNNFFFIPT